MKAQKDPLEDGSASPKRSLFAAPAHIGACGQTPASLSLPSREAFYAAIRFIDTTPLYGVKGVRGRLRLVASAAFCAAMRFNDAPGPIGRHGACGNCGRGQRPLPAALRFMARATSLCAKAFAASRLVASADLPSFTHFIGAGFSWPHYTTLLDLW